MQILELILITILIVSLYLHIGILFVVGLMAMCDEKTQWRFGLSDKEGRVLIGAFWPFYLVFAICLITCGVVGYIINKGIELMDYAFFGNDDD